jgi:hypothetical protein
VGNNQSRQNGDNYADGCQEQHYPRFNFEVILYFRPIVGMTD